MWSMHVTGSQRLSAFPTQTVTLFFLCFLPFLLCFHGSAERANCISAGLEAWRWRAVWLWANTWPWLGEQTRSAGQRRRRRIGDRCAAGSLGVRKSLEAQRVCVRVCAQARSGVVKQWSTNVRTRKMCVSLFVNDVWFIRVSEALKQPPHHKQLTLQSFTAVRSLQLWSFRLSMQQASAVSLIDRVTAICITKGNCLKICTKHVICDMASKCFKRAQKQCARTERGQKKRRCCRFLQSVAEGYLTFMKRKQKREERKRLSAKDTGRVGIDWCKRSCSLTWV